MQLTEHIHLVGSGAMGFDLTDARDCHIYLVDSGPEAAIIDSGSGFGVDQILANCTRAGVSLDRIRYLWLTHAHADHAGGAARLKERLPHLQVVASPLAARWLRTGDEKSISLDMGKRAGFYPRDYVFQPCPVEREVSEGDTVTVGNVTLKVVETPGHCDGHISLIGQVDGRTVLFGGDLVFYGGQVSLQNIWDCRIPDYANSMKKFAGAGIDALLPGHLTISLQRGQRHLDTANQLFENIYVPKAIF